MADPSSSSESSSAEHPDRQHRPWRTLNDGPSRQGKRRAVLREIVVIVVCVLAFTWTLQTFVGRQYVIPSESMEQTLHGCKGCTNDRIVIDKVVYRFGDPKPGDVIVFKAPTTSWDLGWQSPRSSNTILRGLQNAASWFGFAPPDENNLVKRVIATGGQRIECHKSDKTGVKVDGKVLSEPYIDIALQRREAANPLSNPDQYDPCYGPDFGPVLVPKGFLWVMGDNRSYSADSRYHQEDQYHGTVPIDDVRGKVRFIIYPFSRIGAVDSINPQNQST